MLFFILFSQRVGAGSHRPYVSPTPSTPTSLSFCGAEQFCMEFINKKSSKMDPPQSAAIDLPHTSNGRFTSYKMPLTATTDPSSPASIDLPATGDPSLNTRLIPATIDPL